MTEETARHVERARRRRARRVRARWGLRAQRLNRRARAAGAEGRVTGDELAMLVASYSSRCAYCAKPLDFACRTAGESDGVATFDHVKPLSRGGRGDVGNLAPACHGCNQERAAWPNSALGVPAPRRFDA